MRSDGLKSCHDTQKNEYKLNWGQNIYIHVCFPLHWGVFFTWLKQVFGSWRVDVHPPWQVGVLLFPILKVIRIFLLNLSKYTLVITALHFWVSDFSGRWLPDGVKIHFLLFFQSFLINEFQRIFFSEIGSKTFFEKNQQYKLHLLNVLGSSDLNFWPDFTFFLIFEKKVQNIPFLHFWVPNDGTMPVLVERKSLRDIL